MNSCCIMAWKAASISRGCGLPVQLYTLSSSITSLAAWHACRMLSARRMSPLHRVRIASLALGSILHLSGQRRPQATSTHFSAWITSSRRVSTWLVSSGEKRKRVQRLWMAGMILFT